MKVEEVHHRTLPETIHEVPSRPSGNHPQPDTTQGLRSSLAVIVVEDKEEGQEGDPDKKGIPIGAAAGGKKPEGRPRVQDVGKIEEPRDHRDGSGKGDTLANQIFGNLIRCQKESGQPIEIEVHLGFQWVALNGVPSLDGCTDRSRGGGLVMLKFVACPLNFRKSRSRYPRAYARGTLKSKATPRPKIRNENLASFRLEAFTRMLTPGVLSLDPDRGSLFFPGPLQLPRASCMTRKHLGQRVGCCGSEPNAWL